MSEFNFGDKILWQGKPGVFLHADNVLDSRTRWISYQVGEYDSLESWVNEDEIIRVEQVSDHPQEVNRNIRDKMILILGQLAGLKHACDNSVQVGLEGIEWQLQALIKQLFTDYE